jgi:hypothetical protein
VRPVEELDLTVAHDDGQFHLSVLRSWMSRDEALAMEGSGWGGDLDPGILTKLDRNNRVQIAPLVHGPRRRAARRVAVTGRPGRFRRDRRRGGGGRRARRRAA